MNNIVEKYTVVLHDSAAELLNKNQFASYFVHNDSEFGPCIKCASIDPAGVFLSLEAFLNEEVTASVQIPHSYVLYILGGEYKRIGFKLKDGNEWRVWDFLLRGA